MLIANTQKNRYIEYMKIYIISDIHGSATDLAQVLSDFDKEKADFLLLIGDYLNHGPRNAIPMGYDTKKTAEMLNKYTSKIMGIRGNCDSEVDQMMLNFPCLADFSQLLISSKKDTKINELNGRIFLHHGHLYTRDYLKTILPKGTLIISGHTHVPVLEEDEGYYFLNPGSISIPKNKDGTLSDKKTFAIIDTDENGIKEIEILFFDGSSCKKFSDIITKSDK